MPKDTPETNALLRTESYPEFSQYNQMKIFTGSAKITLEHDIQLTKHLKQLEGMYMRLYIFLNTE